jgi:hypothetical protein
MKHFNNRKFSLFNHMCDILFELYDNDEFRTHRVTDRGSNKLVIYKTEVTKKVIVLGM